MGYFIVEDEYGGEHFIEAMVAGMAMVQVPNGKFVRIASQNDIEEHWEEVQNHEAAPQVSRVFSSPE